MRGKNRKPIASCLKLPPFTTTNVIDGQAGLIIYASLIFYSLTIDNILNVIVLLILAGVSIAMLTGSNGLLTQAQKAKEETEKANVEEQRQLTMAEAAMNLDGKEYKSTYNNKEVTVPIPAGFAVSQVEGENTVEDGLVIIDSNGNEFVWIPVAKETFSTNFKRVEGYLNGSLEDWLPEKTDEADKNGEVRMITEDTSIQKEAKAMYKSVEDNEGFYFGRYEAGKDDNGNVVSKKNAKVYNKIVWGESTVGVVSGGAVEKARNMYQLNSSVVSHLCYGVEWDAALNFIDPNYITSNCSPDSYVANANDKGWSSSNYLDGNPEHLTGIDVDSNKSNCQKNIYDMAGNVSELTMEIILPPDEGINKPCRTRRGCGFDWACNASNRSTGGTYVNEEKEFIGFRVVLYLK